MKSFFQRISWKTNLTLISVYLNIKFQLVFSEAAVQRCSQEKAFWKYVANLLENTHAEVWSQ